VKSRIFAVVLLIGPGLTLASAQTSLQIPLQFDFLNPGAKSMGLGGAFVGLADDATAAFANPAGLTQIGKSEMSFEARATRLETRFLQRGRLSGVISNQLTDTVQGAVFGESPGRHVGVGFVSAVYVDPSHRWFVAAYRHELVRVDQTVLSEGVFQKAPEEFTSRRDSPQEGVRKISITGYGGSGSYNVRRGLAIGATVAVYTFDMASVFRRFDTVGFLGPPDFAVELARATQEGKNVAVAPSLGVMIARGPVRLGGLYRHGASFDFVTSDGATPDRDGVFRVPDTLAFGVSFRPRPTILVAADITRVSYSRIREDFVTAQAIGVGREASFDLDNGVEVHAGLQYLAASRRFIPRLRVGAWYDPDHSVHFTPSPQSVTAVDRLFDERLATALSTGKNQVHFTGGAGLTFNPHLELNAGFDLASTTKLFSTSLIVR